MIIGVDRSFLIRNWLDLDEWFKVRFLVYLGINLFKGMGFLFSVFSGVFNLEKLEIYICVNDMVWLV